MRVAHKQSFIIDIHVKRINRCFMLWPELCYFIKLLYKQFTVFLITVLNPSV